MKHVDWDGACSACPWTFGKRGDDLQEALGPDEVVTEVWPQGVSAPGGPGDFAAPFTQEGVVHDGHEGLDFEQLCEDGASRDGKQLLQIEACPGEQSVASGPVDELLSAGGQQSGDGVTAEGDQAADGDTERTAMGTVLREGRPGLIPEVAKTIE